MAVWVVTGGAGFLGRHVLDALQREPGVEAVALGRRCPAGWNANAFVGADLERPETLGEPLERLRPAVVIHAAGKTPPADPDRLHAANVLGTLHLLQVLQRLGRPARVVTAGSAAELGPVAVENLPIGEDHPAGPVDPYGRSKLEATRLALLDWSPIESLVARVFNPVGPGQPRNQAFGRFAALLLDPAVTALDVGDLTPRRDFVDVRDVARALIALARRGRAGMVYNVATGRSRSVGEGLERLLLRSGRRIEVRVDPVLAARPGPADCRADVRRIAAEAGWNASVPFETSLDELWDEARGCH